MSEMIKEVIYLVLFLVLFNLTVAFMCFLTNFVGHPVTFEHMQGIVTVSVIAVTNYKLHLVEKKLR